MSKNKTGCVQQTTRKYTTRPSPPYPGNECPGQTRVGNDGNMWVSRADSRGVYTWKRMEGTLNNRPSTSRQGVNVDGMSIPVLKTWMIDKGYEKEVWNMTHRKPAPKKADWVRAVKNRIARTDHRRPAAPPLGKSRRHSNLGKWIEEQNSLDNIFHNARNDAFDVDESTVTRRKPAAQARKPAAAARKTSGCSKVRKADCAARSDCDWIVGKGCKSSERFIWA
jgi:hypothetical protein